MRRSIGYVRIAMAALAILFLSVQSSEAISDVWVADMGSPDISIIDPTAPGPAAGTFNLGFLNAIPAMTQVEDEVWVSSNFNGTVRRYDLQRQYIGEFSVSSTTPAHAMTQVGDEVWLTKAGGSIGVLRRNLDGSPKAGLSISIPNRIVAMTFAVDRIWVADEVLPMIRPVSPTGGSRGPDVYLDFDSNATVASLTTVTLYDWPAVEGPPLETVEVWAGNAFDDQILRLDPMTGALIDSFYAGLTYGAEALAFVNDVEYTPPPGGLADFDQDGDVDLDDFVILKKNFGLGQTFWEGDANFDGRVSLTDFVILKQNFATAAVPEPTSLLLVAASAAWVGRRRRR